MKHKLVVPLYLLIAQQRAACVFSVETSHLKVLGELYDRCHETLEQYAAFLFSTMPPNEYAELLPTVGDLCSKYNVEPEVAFFICRPAISYLEEKSKKENGGKAAKKEEGDASAASSVDGGPFGEITAVLPAIVGAPLPLTLFHLLVITALYIFVPKQRYESEIKRLSRRTSSIAPDANRFGHG